MGFLSGLFGGGKGGGDSQPTATSSYSVVDPLQAQKTAVATPLSQFLAGRVGQGLGEYPTDPNYTNRYNEFLQYNPSEYFEKNISDPSIAQYKRDILPIIQEGYAGGLRGSGRYGAEEAGLNTFAEQLSAQRAQFVPQFAQAQLQEGQTEFGRRYQNWYQSLPETNPILSQAINFLNAGKQETQGYGASFPSSSPGLFGEIGGQLLSKSLGSIGNPTGGFNPQTGQANTQSFGDATYKNPQFWISLASLLAA